VKGGLRSVTCLARLGGKERYHVPGTLGERGVRPVSLGLSLLFIYFFNQLQWAKIVTGPSNPD